ncbi:MAG TPA: type II toxin-antitoxin system VapC family toxin [Verrucomicrobiae bacterium]|nr:type II toxin-antitoxin system VapC family toxin [Verrucomicrobiae bacterium]
MAQWAFDAGSSARTHSQFLEIGGPNGLCSISLLESAILHRLGRLELTGSLDEFFAAALSADVQVLELTPAIASKTSALPEQFHGDPFDRTIVATAAVLKLTLITADPAIRDAKLCPVEYYPFRPSRSGK